MRRTLALPSTVLLSALLAACGAPQPLSGPLQTAGSLSAPTERSLNLVAGQTRPLALNVSGRLASPADVVWQSSDVGVATVDVGGNVTAQGAGQARVQARLRADPSVSLSYAVNVTAAPGLGGSYERQVLSLVNVARAQARTCGSQLYPAAPPLSWNNALGAEAAAYSRDMATRGFFGHTSPEGRNLTQRLASVGSSASSAAENLGGGQPTPQSVVQNWLLSPSFCANVMNPAFGQMGVGYTAGGQYGSYWVQTLTN